MAKGGINRTINIPQPSIFGRIGTGVGKGLAEQLPKEIERTRLKSALTELGEKENLSPFQRFTSLVSAPGITPQAIQTGGELLRQQGMAQGFRKAGAQGQQENPYQKYMEEKNTNVPRETGNGLRKEPTGLVNPKYTEEALNNYIPKNLDQLKARAGELLQNEPEIYQGDPKAAFNGAVQEDAQNQAISKSKQTARESQIGVESRIREQLKDLRKQAKVEIPDNVFQQVENDMIEKVANGAGELETAKEGQKKLDEISRQYQDVENLGLWGVPLQRPESIKTSVETLRKKFKDRDDLTNLADTLNAKGYSTPNAYHSAFKIEDTPGLRQELNKFFKDERTRKFTKEDYNKSFKELAQAMGKTGSPLAIAEELRRKHYDPNLWMRYLDENQHVWKPTDEQKKQLGKGVTSWFPSLFDLFLYVGTNDNEAIGD